MTILASGIMISRIPQPRFGQSSASVPEGHGIKQGLGSIPTQFHAAIHPVIDRERLQGRHWYSIDPPHADTVSVLYAMGFTNANRGALFIPVGESRDPWEMRATREPNFLVEHALTYLQKAGSITRFPQLRSEEILDPETNTRIGLLIWYQE